MKTPPPPRPSSPALKCQPYIPYIFNLHGFIVISHVNKMWFGYSFLEVIYIYIELMAGRVRRGGGVIMLWDYVQISSPLCCIMKTLGRRRKGGQMLARLNQVLFEGGEWSWSAPALWDTTNNHKVIMITVLRPVRKLLPRLHVGTVRSWLQPMDELWPETTNDITGRHFSLNGILSLKVHLVSISIGWNCWESFLIQTLQMQNKTKKTRHWPIAPTYWTAVFFCTFAFRGRK